MSNELFTCMDMSVTMFDTVNMTTKLKLSTDTNVVNKNGLNQLHFLKRLRSLNVWSWMLLMVYQSFVARAIFCAGFLGQVDQGKGRQPDRIK